MKQFIFLCVCSFMVACNGNNKPEHSATADKISKEDELKMAVKKYPDSTQLLGNLVNYYLVNQNYDAALTTINTGMAKDSTKPELWDMKSAIAAQKGDTAIAIKCLEKAIVLLPNPQYIISLGALYAETKNPMALQMADALLVASKSHSEKEAYFIKGLYYSYINDKEKAIGFFETCIKLDYTFVEAYLEKGLALYDTKKYADAAAVLEKAVKVQNQFVRGYYYLGQCYEKLNRTQDAIEVYQVALQLEPDDDEVKDALGRLGVK